MDTLLNALIRIGPITLLAGMLAALILYLRAHAAAGPFLGFAWRVALVAIVGLKATSP